MGGPTEPGPGKSRQAGLGLVSTCPCFSRAPGEVPRKLKRLYEAVETGGIAPEDVAEPLQKLKVDRRRVEEERRGLLRKHHSA